MEKNYYSYFGEGCVSLFVNEIMTRETIASVYFKTNIPLQVTSQEEVKFQPSDVSWLCEASFAECENACEKDTGGASRKVRTTFIWQKIHRSSPF